MTERQFPHRHGNATDIVPNGKTVPAAGLFGFAIHAGQLHSFKATEGYLRDMEQMPNFAPPSVSNFVAHYLASNIGKTHSSS